MHPLSLYLLAFLCFCRGLAWDVERNHHPVRPSHATRPQSQSRHREISASTTNPENKITIPDSTHKNMNGPKSSNWAGAVLGKLPNNATYTYVAATITVPTATAVPSPSGSSTLSSSSPNQQAASAWVGIDGDTWTTALLQTGINFFVTDGKAYVEPWYEWYPGYSLDYDNFSVNPGDIIIASVNATSAREGVCSIENLTTGRSATKTVSAPRSMATLRGWNAEWAVEDFKTAGTDVPLCGFNDVRFDGCAAEAGGAHYGVEAATVYDLVNGEKVLATAETYREADSPRFANMEILYFYAAPWKKPVLNDLMAEFQKGEATAHTPFAPATPIDLPKAV